ncbi:uncharacterized protein LOC115668694 [Syzygium oleosum]|uniref:uncharacterized protein LOC115668694 n=1 Tax=Syzygium oleosum TaxID=219896 RepID=UPI0011D2A2F9|nr:uncharacterized protein LOC115668694 [Syzygium oleosum]
MSSEGKGVGRGPRRGAGREARGRGCARARAVEDLGMGARAIENPGVGVEAAVNPGVDVRAAADPRVDGVIRALEEFMKLKPPKFDGRGDLEAASLWIEELEKAFEVLGCNDEEKVTLAAYQLQGNANDWWEATMGRVFPAGIAQNWAMFVETFNSKYFSESTQEQKLAEFMRLHQGQRTVEQYEADFTQLAKFAPRMVENPLDRARRFRDDLR